MKFKVGDKVRRKAECQDGSVWKHGDSVKQVESSYIADDFERITLVGICGPFMADYFDLVEPQAEQSMGPIEAFVTRETIDDSLIRQFSDGLGNPQGQTIEVDCAKRWLDRINAAIATERVNGKRDYFTMGLELDEANEKYADEKKRRIYYQGMVYSICGILNVYHRRKPGAGVVCGTVDEPSNAVISEVNELAAKVSLNATPHDYDLLKAANVHLTSDVESLQVREAIKDGQIEKLQAENDRLARENERLATAVANAEYNAGDVERLTSRCADAEAEVERLKQLNHTICTADAKDDAPRNEIAWLIGWLNCDLAYKDDDPGRGVVERIDTVDAWLKS